MLDLVKSETERIDSRFLEPACGSGNFLIPVLERKLAVVQSRYGRNDFERRHYALLALMSVYGVELLPDNAAECRARLLSTFAAFLRLAEEDGWWPAAQRVLALNVVEGDALTMTAASGNHITFPEWGYLGRGKFQRRDFRYDALTQRSSVQGSLFENLEEHEVFVPVAIFPPMTVRELAA
ncbi:SAM-dependent DNA methyltransferase [Lacisediminihabitans sp. FW035]